MFNKNNQISRIQILLGVGVGLVLLSLACGLGGDSETETSSEVSESQTEASASTPETTEPPDTSTSGAADWAKQGVDHFEKGDYEQAVTAFSEAIKLDSNYAPAYHERGNAYQKLGEHEKAIADFTRAIELEHDPLSWPYNSRGMSHFASGDNEQGLADFDQALELDPNYANAYNNRGLIYHQILRDTEQALADYNQAIELDPEHAKAYSNRGWLYTDRGEYEQAIADLTTAIELDPNNASAFRNRGMAYYGAGNTEQSIADLTAAIELNPEDTLAYSNRGFAYSQIGQYEQAIADLTTAIELNPNFAQAYLNRAVAYQGAGNLNEAIIDLETYLELQPDSPKREQVETLISDLMAEASATVEEAELPPGNSIRVNDNVSADKGDILAFLGTSGSGVVISVEPEAGLDMAIEIHDVKTGQVLATVNESSGKETLSFQVPTDIRSDLYRVLVGSVNGVSGKYTAFLTGSSGISFSLQPNYFVAGRLPESNSLTYTYTGPGGQNLQAMVMPHPDTKVDLILIVHSLNDLENALLEVNDTGLGEKEEFSFTLPEEGTGTYIISIKEANSKSGKYILAIKTGAASASAPATGSTGPVNSNDVLITEDEANTFYIGAWKFDDDSEYDDPDPTVCRDFVDNSAENIWYVSFYNCIFEVGPDRKLEDSKVSYPSATPLDSKHRDELDLLFYGYRSDSDHVTYDMLTLKDGRVYLASITHRNPSLGAGNAPSQEYIDDFLFNVLTTNLQKNY